MKSAIDLDGIRKSVSAETMVKAVNGAYYVMSQKEIDEFNQFKNEWEQKKIIILAEKNYKLELGTAEEQLEYATINGWEALRDRNLKIKAKYK